MKLDGLNPDRKILVKRIEELTGSKAIYSKMPLCEYVVGDYHVDRAGSLLVADTEADMGLLQELAEEGLVEAVTPAGMNIEFPMEGHTDASLRNLVNLIYTRADLINKATGSHFRVSQDLVELLKEETDIPDAIEAYANDIDGLKITNNRVCFTGFHVGSDPVACMKLAALMNKHAMTRKRIQAKKIDDENEKYAFRVWLMSIGMIGDEYKDARKALLKNLSGDPAFRKQR